MTENPDAVVIGSGPNGLVAANMLADEGWDVLVLEAQPEPGGAVRSGELTKPGFVHDRFSAFYPLAAASPVVRGLHLEDFGLRWRRAPLALAHPTPDGACAVLSTDLDETAASLDNYAPGDGAAWRELYAQWQRAGRHLIDALLTPFPPVRAGGRLAAALGPREWARFARFVLLPVRAMADDSFRGTGGALLLAGNTLHTDLGPEQTLGGMFGWVLASLGQEHGFPVPEGGSSRLTDALVRRLEARGGRVVCSTPVTAIEVRGRRAVAVRTAHGDEIGVRRAVLADVGAPALYGSLVRPEHLPPRILDGMRRFRYDHATVKIDWALDAKVPWSAEPAGRAGTVHLGDSLDHLTEYSAQLVTGHVPARPFVLHRPARAHAADARSRGCQSREWRGERRDGSAAPAADLPAHRRTRASRDTDPRAVPRVGVRPPRRRRARRLRRQRRPRRALRRAPSQGFGVAEYRYPELSDAKTKVTRASPRRRWAGGSGR